MNKENRINRYIRTKGKWQKYIQVRQADEKSSEPCYEWVDWHITNIPLPILIEELEDLSWELTTKEIELEKVKTEFAEKEFNIKYVENIDFKALYGKANDDTRKHHVNIVCEDLIKQKIDLELSINFLKREITLLKTVINIKNKSYPQVQIKPPQVHFGKEGENK